MDWLKLARSPADLLGPSPGGTLTARTLRKDGVELAA